MDYRIKIKIGQFAAYLIAAAVLAIAFCNAASAQNGGYDCVIAPDDSTSVSYIEVPPSALPHPNIRDALLRLRVHVIRDENYGGGWSQAQVDSQITRLRADYARRHIYFQVVGIDDLPSIYADDLNYWTQVFVLQNELVPDATAINVVLGTAVSSAVRPFGVTLADRLPAYRCLVGAKSSHSSGVLSHEVGHCLGLYHTFDHANNCTDVPWENPEDCADCGDLVCDTNWDPHDGSQDVGYLWDHTNPVTCAYDSSFSGANPDPSNIMAYTLPACMEDFTIGQAERMLGLIETASLLQNKRVKSPVVYENRSGETGLDYSGTPYSSVAFDYDNDGKKDLFIAIRDGVGSLQKQNTLSNNEVPQFDDRTEYDIDMGSQPQMGLRGLAAADYDNDGNVDLFAAADSLPRLYHNNNGAFADSASALGLTAHADSSYAGVWGDYDRDGQVDLYICRGTGGGNDPTPGNISAVRGYLMRNDVRSSGDFECANASSGIGSTAVSASVTASWADVDSNNTLDLFVGELRSGGTSSRCRLYINNGSGHFTEEFVARFDISVVDSVNSVAWADMNNDGHLDLVLGGRVHSPMVLFNNGSGHFDGSGPLRSDFGEMTNGVRPVDHDLDGRTDLVVLPKAGGKHPWIFTNRSFDSVPRLIDESYQVGFTDTTGRADGLVAADFNNDGDADLYVGRPVASDQYYFRATTASGDDPMADWVGVRLEAGGGNNNSAIGTKVRFQIGTSFDQLQMVDGGSGRGGQGDTPLICGLGDRTGTVQAVVTWPGGYLQTATLTRNQIATITDATSPGVPDSVSGTYTAIPEGLAELTFTWDTPYSCNPSLDKVTLTDPAHQPSQCVKGTVVLTPADSDVTHEVVAKIGSGYRHTLTWHLECVAPCGYNYIVESATDSTHKDPMTTAKKVTMSVCISQ